MAILDNDPRMKLKALQATYSAYQKTLDRLNKWCEAETGYCLDTLMLVQSNLQEKMFELEDEIAFEVMERQRNEYPD